MSLLDELNSGGLQMTHCCNELNAGAGLHAMPPLACLAHGVPPASLCRSILNWQVSSGWYMQLVSWGYSARGNAVYGAPLGNTLLSMCL